MREDHLNGLAVGQSTNVMRDGADGAIKAAITELRPLGVFATWQAERVIGDRDRDPQAGWAGLEPGMTVRIKN